MIVAVGNIYSVRCLISVVIILCLESCSNPTVGGQCDANWRQACGSCYFFSDQSAKWTDARQACIDQSATLATIKSQDQQDFIKSCVSSQNYWFGLSDREAEGTWVWEDKDKLADYTTYWEREQPDDWLDDEECCMMYGSTNRGLWNDGSCERVLPYVCQKDINVSHTEASTTTATRTVARTTEDTTTEVPTTTASRTVARTTEDTTTEVPTTTATRTVARTTENTTTEVPTTTASRTVARTTENTTTEVPTTTASRTVARTTEHTTTEVPTTTASRTVARTTEDTTTEVPTTTASRTVARTTEDTTTEVPTTTPTAAQTTATSVPLTPTAPTSSSPSTCKCTCTAATGPEIPDNMTLDQFKAQLVKQIENELTLNASSLASSRAKKTSAPDARLSGQMAGGVALGVIAIVGLLVVLPDLMTLVRYCKNPTSPKKSPEVGPSGIEERA